MTTLVFTYTLSVSSIKDHCLFLTISVCKLLFEQIQSCDNKHPFFSDKHNLCNS